MMIMVKIITLYIYFLFSADICWFSTVTNFEVAQYRRFRVVKYMPIIRIDIILQSNTTFGARGSAVG